MRKKSHGVEFFTTIDLAGDASELKRIQIFVIGVQPIRDGRKIKCTIADAQAVIAAFNDQHNEVPVLYEHGEDPARGLEAGGWIKKMELIGDGLFAFCEYLPGCAQEIRDKKWRYASASFRYETDSAGFKHPVYVREVSVTNTPAVDALEEVAAKDQSTEDTTAKDTMECGSCKGKFTGTHAETCDTKKGSGKMAENRTEGKEIIDMDEKALKELEEKLAKQLEELTAKLAAQFSPEAITNAVFEKVREAARKDAEARLAIETNREKFSGVLNGAEKEGRLTTAQRAAFVELVGEDADAAKAEKYVSSLPKTVPTGGLSQSGKPVDVTGTEDDENADLTAVNELNNKAVRYARDNGMTFVEAMEFLTQGSSGAAK
jgi:phage I-like protein